MMERESICAMCGKTFRYNAATTPRKYCDECKPSAYQRMRRSAGIASYRRRTGLKPWTSVCCVCGKEFVTARENRVTCGDPDCVAENRRRNNTRRCNEKGQNMPMEEWRALTAARKAENEKRRQEQHDERMRTAVCVICGNEFRTMSKSKSTCSSECSKEKARRKSREYGRLRDRKLHGDAVVDNDITLEGLYERDGGVCYICGEKCDWEDRKIDGRYFTAGKLYPSIDHVVPLARGGKNAWNNVRLAHRVCNSKKCDKDPTLYVDDLEIEDAYKMKRYIRPGHRRGVRQYTKSGELVATYESLKEAEDKTGVPHRRIIECAKGRHKTSYGYVWKYA